MKFLRYLLPLLLVLVAVPAALAQTCAGGAESTDKSTVTTVGPILTDANHCTFAINGGAQILINGVADTVTGNVIELAYVNHVLWQENASLNWYSYNGTPGSYTGPTMVSPLNTSGGTGQTSPPAPLTGTVSPQAWASFDQRFAGVSLPSGKPFHFNALPPAQYNPSLYKYPLMVWLHPDGSGNAWYTGGNTDPFFYVPNEPANFNTVSFLTAHPSVIAVPYADQTCPEGSAVCNWGGWVNNGLTGSGSVNSGDTGPNVFGIIAMIQYLQTIYSIDPARIYVQGFSLGGIGSSYLMLHYNAYTGDLGHIFTAGGSTGGVLEINGFGAGPSTANATQMASVPVWWFAGANDGTSVPSHWDLPMWRLLANNSNYPSAITSPTANQAGTSQMRFTLCPTCGHQPTDASGNSVSVNPTIMNWMYGLTSSVSPTGTGQFIITGGKIFDPNGKLYIPVGINIDQNETAIAVTNAAGQPLTTLFPGINHIRLRTNSTANPLASNATYPDPTSFDAVVNALTPLGIVVEIEDHSCNGGYIESPGAGVTSTICAIPQPGQANFTPMANFWAALATHFKSNPYVWFGSLNEPCSDSACSYGSGVALVSNYHQGMYNAIRGTGNTSPIQLLAGIGGGNCQTVGAGAGSTVSIYAPMTNIVWELHTYNSDGATPGNNGQIAGSVGQACGYLAAQTIQSHDGIVPVIFGEWGSGDGNPNSTNASQQAAGLIAAAKTPGGYGNTGWAWFPSTQWQMVNNGFTAGGPFSLTTWGGIMANVVAQVAPLSGGGQIEKLTVNSLSSVAASTPFSVSGSVINSTGTPVLQYQNNNGAWTNLPAGSTTTSVGFSFVDPGFGTAGTSNNTVSVRDASNNSVTATSNQFTVLGTESSNNSVITASLTAPTFTDSFTSLSLHRTWQAGDNWQLIAPDTPDGRGGPNFSENGDQYWVNPFNPATPINGIYVQNASGLHLNVLQTPAAQAAAINASAGATMPYVAALLNTSQTNYQKYGYWEITAAVPRVPGITFQADTENVQITGQFPPEIDLRISTASNNVETVLFQFALGGGVYTQFTIDTSSGFNPAVSHTYAWDWESDFITFYIDGVQRFQAANPSTAYRDQPMFLFILSAANYIGNGDPSAAALPTGPQITAVNIYPTKPAAVSSGSLIDSIGEVWTITAGGQVAVNGVADPTTSGVVEMAYVNHTVWYETNAGLWQFKTRASDTWQPVPGTSTPPITIAESPNNTVVTTVGPQITNAAGTTFSISSGAQIIISGTVDTVTGNVVELAYVNHVLWQLNAAGNWYSYNGTPGSYTGPTTTSPLPVEFVTVNAIAQQITNIPFTVTGGVAGVTAIPTLQYQDNAGPWTPFPAGSLITLGTPTPGGVFLASAGQFTDPNGGAFVPRGINLADWAAVNPSGVNGGGTNNGALLLTMFPKINFVRVNLQKTSPIPQVNGNDDPAAFDTFVATLTAAHVVVEFENHDIGTVYTGATLTQESAMYAGYAARFKTNPYVWLGTMNEPQAPAGQQALITTEQLSNYTAIRGTGNNNPILLELIGGYTQNQGGAGGALTASTYPTMTNTAWDLHYYNWLATNGTLPYTTNASLIASTLTNTVATVKAFASSANGVMPVFLGEFGESAGGDTVDPGGSIVVSTVQASGLPGAEWTWFAGAVDRISDGNSNLTSPYGTQAVAWIGQNSSPASTATYSFPHPGMATNPTNTVNVRDANNTSAVGSSNGFGVISTTVETISINTLAPQTANTAFNVTGAINGVTSAPTLQYQDNNGTWQPFPSGSTVTATTYSFTHGGLSVNPAQVLAVRDANNTSAVGTITYSVVAASGTSTTWNPSDLTSSITLTNANLTALSISAVQGGVRSATSHTTGNYCYDLPMNTVTPRMAVGLANSTYALGGPVAPGADTNAIAFYPAQTGSPQSMLYAGTTVLRSVVSALTPTSGGVLVDTSGNAWTLQSDTQVYENGNVTPSSRGTSQLALVNNVVYGQDGATLGWFTYNPSTQVWTAAAAPTLPVASIPDVSGDITEICVNLTTQKAWVSTPAMHRVAGVIWNSDVIANQNPATGTGGASFSGMVCPCYIMMDTPDLTTSVTIDTTGPLTVALPSGFQVWQPVPTILHHPFLFNFGQRVPANDDAKYEPVRFERMAR